MANKATLVQNVKRRINNHELDTLMTLLKFRLDTVKTQMIDVDDDDFKRYQGRARELKELIDDLSRKPVDAKKQKTGAFI